MATNKITIEVDYGKSVARIGELELTFKQLEQAATKSRNAIKKAVRDTETSLAGTVKALTRERAALVESQSTLARNNEEYRKFQRQIDLVSKQIERLTDTRKREEVTLKNSANGLKQQIALIQQEMNNRKLSNTQYRLMQEEIEKLEARYNSLTNTVKEGTISAFDQQIAALQREQREVATTKQRIEELEQQITSLKMRKAELAGGTRDASKAMEGMSSSAGASGAVVTEFGRTIGDAPFGLMGMANNLQQLSQQFVDLQAKSGGTKQAFQSIMQTIMGPAGFVVAINIITSAIVAYNMRKDKAKQKTEEFNASLLLEKNTLEALNVLYNNSNKNLENRINITAALSAADEKFAKALEKLGIDEAARQELTQQFIKDRMALNDAEEKRNSIAEDEKDLLSEKLLSQEEVNALEKQYARLLLSTSAGAIDRANQIALILKRNSELADVTSQLVEATIEAADAQDRINKLLEQSDYDKAIQDLKAYQEELRLLNNFKEGPERLAEELRVLKEDLAKEAVRAGTTETAAYQEILLSVLQKERELYEAQEEIKEEASDKDKDRLEKLAELNQQYIDNLEAQGDELGLIRLMQQERDAIKEAKALGASQDLINKITQDFANQRQEILDKEAEERTDKEKKETEKAEKEKNKIKEKALKDNQKKIEEYFDKEIESMKARTQMMSDILTNFSTLLDELDAISQSRFQRQINALKVERDVIRSNDELTKEEKEAQLTEIQDKENALQVRRIKSERDMFTIKQTIAIAEMIMKQKMAIQEQILLAQLGVAKAKLAVQGLAVSSAEQAGKLQMTLPEFIKGLGVPFGVITFAASIGGMIASIVSARRKAQAEIAGLSNAPISLGGGSSGASAPATPNFNVVGSSSQNQLAQAIAGSQSEPVRAYVVSSDVTTAQELDRKIVEGASI